jgi:hypothetical protein
MDNQEKETKTMQDNELGIPMRVVAALLAFFGWRFIFLAYTNPDEYLENATDLRTIFYMVLLAAVLVLLSMGALIGKVPKRFTAAAKSYNKR